jgi:hypothetical protein
MASRAVLQQVWAKRALASHSPFRTASFSTMTKVLQSQAANTPASNNNSNNQGSEAPETHFGFKNVPEAMKENLGMRFIFQFVSFYQSPIYSNTNS